MKNSGRLSLWERYLSREIGIEFKACLYFFCVLFYYGVYRLCTGRNTAELLHMAEMILLCYAAGYLQVYALWNFDEAEKLGKKETAGLVICVLIYTAGSWLFNWLDRSAAATAGFAAWTGVMFLSAFLVYRYRRILDDKKLNEDLKIFQARGGKSAT